MKFQPLSPETRRRLDRLFPPAARQAAERLLVEKCGTNLPMLENLDQHQLERYRFAALKLSKGQMPELENAVALAQTDWRDLLVAADFGDDLTAHLRWSPEGGS